MSEVSVNDTLYEILVFGTIVVTILIFTHVIYWMRRKTRRISYTRIETTLLFIVLVLLEIVIFVVNLIAGLGNPIMYELYIIQWIGLPAILVLVLAWGRKQEN